ncbi:hypothetical protein VSU16_02555 [Cetobacterium somerae]|uniref:hypothetical protein n=1 Tax=Cetobacterium somerae TaxID=188913 RepID=UPI002E7BA854|nr:hypothetical protein [Cetobacterium somerae]WVJ01622.1 hypothetical protein VSU16_02555 [Cetobacterium somerae]
MDILVRCNVIDLINQYIEIFNSFDNIYLYGSILDTSKTPNDVDILLIYSKYSNNLINDLDTISFILKKMNNLPIDLTVLSIEEEKDTNFLERLKSKYVKLK